MRIGKIAGSAKYQMDEEFQNCQSLEPNFDFPNWKKTLKFLNFPIWTIPEYSNLKNSEEFQFGKFQKIVIWQNQKTFNLEN